MNGLHNLLFKNFIAITVTVLSLPYNLNKFNFLFTLTRTHYGFLKQKCSFESQWNFPWRSYKTLQDFLTRTFPIFVTSPWILFIFYTNTSTLKVREIRDNVSSIATASRVNMCCDWIYINFVRPQIANMLEDKGRWTNKMHKFLRIIFNYFSYFAVHVSDEPSVHHQEHYLLNCITQFVHSCRRV